MEINAEKQFQFDFMQFNYKLPVCTYVAILPMMKWWVWEFFSAEKMQKIRNAKNQNCLKRINKIDWLRFTIVWTIIWFFKSVLKWVTFVESLWSSALLNFQIPIPAWKVATTQLYAQKIRAFARVVQVHIHGKYKYLFSLTAMQARS